MHVAIDMLLPLHSFSHRALPQVALHANSRNERPGQLEKAKKRVATEVRIGMAPLRSGQQKHQNTRPFPRALKKLETLETAASNELVLRARTNSIMSSLE